MFTCWWDSSFSFALLFLKHLGVVGARELATCMVCFQGYSFWLVQFGYTEHKLCQHPSQVSYCPWALLVSQWVLKDGVGILKTLRPGAYLALFISATSHRCLAKLERLCRQPHSPNVIFKQHIGWKLTIFRKDSRMYKRRKRVNWPVVQKQHILSLAFLAKLLLQLFAILPIAKTSVASAEYQFLESCKNLFNIKLSFLPLPLLQQ